MRLTLSSALLRTTRWSARRPGTTIALWVAFVVACLAVGNAVGTRSATTADYRTGEAGVAQQILADGGLEDLSVENVLITARSGTLDRARAQAAAADLTRRMSTSQDVASVGEPVPAPDGDALRVPVTMTAAGASAADDVGALLERTAATQAAYPDLRVSQTGDSSISYQVDTRSAEDTLAAERLSLPITLGILLLAFGAFVAALVPLFLAITSVIAAVGLSTLSSHLFPSVGGNETIIVLIGMAVGVDYSLFYITREREERRRAGGRLDHVAAVELAAATSGRAVLVSGAAVIASVAALFATQDIIFSSLAVSVMIVVAIAMVASVTALPALLVRLGDRLDRPRLPAFGRLGRRDRPTRWGTLLAPAVRRPVLTLTLTSALMIGLALPVLGLRLGLPAYDRMPRVDAIVTHDELTRLYPMQGTRFIVAVRAEGVPPALVASSLDRLEAAALADPALAGRSTPQRRSSASGDTVSVVFGTPYEVDDPVAQDFFHRLHDSIVPATLGPVPGLEYAIGGDVAMTDSDVRHLSDRLPWVLGILLVLTSLMMAAAFRSVALAVVSGVLNLLSVSAALGLLTLVFQSDLVAGLLDLPPGGFVISRVPLFIFVILFGLSMDYHVFVVGRVLELARTGRPLREAVQEGISSTAGVVTSAAVVMISVFAGFVFGGLLEIKQTGFGLAAGVVLDAFVVRILMLPAALALLGDRAWWPSRIPRPSSGSERHRHTVPSH